MRRFPVGSKLLPVVFYKVLFSQKEPENHEQEYTLNQSLEV